MATPPGVAAVAIVRISGPNARQIATACFSFARGDAAHWRAGHMRRGAVVDARTNDTLDDALAVAFWAPRSYTGEDVVELQVHGGAGVAAACLQVALSAGARHAAPGEFTRRAFNNGRMDLAQAEAVADLIDAESRLAARAAAVRLSGALGRRMRTLRDELLARLVEIEAHIDYPDEVGPPDASAIDACIDAQLAAVTALLADAGSGRTLREGVVCVIAGPPNAGKSSLLNALAQSERAIVSPQPGTTRDIVEERVAVDGVVLHLRDTAGLRAATDPIEMEGVKRARAAIGTAALAVCVLDGSRPFGDDERFALGATSDAPRIVVCNKADLGFSGTRAFERDYPDLARDGAKQGYVFGSVHDAATIDAVRGAIARIAWGGGIIDAGKALVANARQVDALARASESLTLARSTVAGGQPIDLLSSDLSAAIAAYGEVTGETVTEEVLDAIFARFCVGK
ncbi:MAG TPA: tRNA uridine-5-carboxymethylaminomethyl(34) synthesis GTPase MnmE [Candidatus Eremiobacteraceae bacterium]